ncbi:class I SAM-dependent methyltransferase [Lysinibacillus sp. KU-BSD001]|uniref:class I SAM-dependent methyltransferase n=1 Tax=Lysinibacillus sp. KU-BSD001 TaxID=3141328 RepID=UPI0036E7E383
MKGPLAIDFEKLWQEGMLDWHGNMPERMVDDSLEEAFWAQSMQKKAYKQTEAHAIPIYKVMKKYIGQEDSVIEIGPGWGNYTFPLAEDVARLTCVDGSESVLSYLAQYFEGANHVSFMHAKWEEAALEQHDVVLGVNCFYRIYEMLDTLKKMNALAKKRAIIGLTTGPIQPHYKILDEKYGYSIKYPRRDYIEILNMLYQLEIYADCEMIQLERTYHYPTMEALVAAQSKKIIDTDFSTEHVLDSLAPFIEQDADGVHYRHTFYAAVISWEPKKELTT